MDGEKAVDMFLRLLAASPVGAALFIIADVREQNLYGHRLGKKPVSTPPASAPAPGNVCPFGTHYDSSLNLCVPDWVGGAGSGGCDQASLTSEYAMYAGRTGMSGGKVLSYDEWKAQFRPECP